MKKLILYTIGTFCISFAYNANASGWLNTNSFPAEMNLQQLYVNHLLHNSNPEAGTPTVYNNYEFNGAYTRLPIQGTEDGYWQQVTYVPTSTVDYSSGSLQRLPVVIDGKNLYPVLKFTREGWNGGRLSMMAEMQTTPTGNGEGNNTVTIDPSNPSGTMVGDIPLATILGFDVAQLNALISSTPPGGGGGTSGGGGGGAGGGEEEETGGGAVIAAQAEELTQGLTFQNGQWTPNN